MKTMLTIGLLTIATLAMPSMPASAATTNLEQNIQFDLVFYEQGPTNVTTQGTHVLVNRLRMTSKDLIKAIGTATSNNFSASAKLLLVTDIASTNGVGAVVIKDGTNSVDVSNYFTATNSELEVFGLSSKGKDNDWDHHPNAGLHLGSAGATYSILYLTVGGPNLNISLNLDGFDTTTHVVCSKGGTTVEVNETSATLTGTGTDTLGTPAVIQGSITILGSNLAVQ